MTSNTLNEFDEHDLVAALVREAGDPTVEPVAHLEAVLDRIHLALGEYRIPAGIRRRKPYGRRPFMFRIACYSGIAATIMLLAVAAAWFLILDRSAGALFAAVQENVEKAKSVSYSNRGKVDNKPLKVCREYISGDHMRTQYEGGSSNVVDLGQKKGLILEPKRKLAFEYTVDEKNAAETRNRMSQLLALLKSEYVQQVGAESLMGRDVVAYQVKVREIAKGLWAYPGAINTVLVDTKTKLPVRVEIKWPNGDFILYDDITWNEEVASDLFQFHVPQGYHVETAEDRLKEMSRAGKTGAPRASSRDGGSKAKN